MRFILLDLTEKPKKIDEEQINKDLGKLMWGDADKEFSMGKLIGSFTKQRIRGFFKSD